MRRLLAVAAGLAVAVVGALILGEYEMVGVVALVAGALYGLAVAEVLAVVGRDAGVPMLVAAAAIAAAGMTWGLWISTGRDFGFATGAGWAGVALGAAAAPLWLRGAARRGERTPSGP